MPACRFARPLFHAAVVENDEWALSGGPDAPPTLRSATIDENVTEIDVNPDRKFRSQCGGAYTKVITELKGGGVSFFKRRVNLSYLVFIFMFRFCFGLVTNIYIFVQSLFI